MVPTAPALFVAIQASTFRNGALPFVKPPSLLSRLQSAPSNSKRSIRSSKTCCSRNNSPGCPTTATFASPNSEAATDDTVPPVPIPPWYSDPDILRDRSHVISSADGGFDYRPNGDETDTSELRVHVGLSPTLLSVLSRPTTKIIPFQGSNVYVRRIESDSRSATARGAVEPLFLSYGECDPCWFSEQGAISWLGQQPLEEGVDDDDDDSKLDYFAVDIPPSADLSTSSIANFDGVESSSVRNYGDVMKSRTQSALLATANGLLTFHRTHRFCSKCGSATAQIKAGSARKCTNEECKTSVYPRIDPAVIMLVTSPCANYALLGRKASWPSGRYSTLAGFAEVGETLEECVVRETLEESGVAVDPESIRFSASQPWPFPRSMMVGFHAMAFPSSSTEDDLPQIHVDPAELDDARWYSKEYVKENGLVEGRGSSALNFTPDDAEAEFHVPGPASLARLLITEWVTGG